MLFPDPPISPAVERRLVMLGDHEAVEAVVGYRTWRLRVTGGRTRLESVYVQALKWLPGERVEKQCFCRTTDPNSPLYNLPGACRGTCGIHAYAEGVQAIDPKVNLWVWKHSHEFIHGEVLLWGKVKIHERGFKAEFAKPAAFYLYPNLEPIHELRVKTAALQFELPLVKET